MILHFRFGEVNRCYFRLVYEGCLFSAYDASNPVYLDGERADNVCKPLRTPTLLADGYIRCAWRGATIVPAFAHRG